MHDLFISYSHKEDDPKFVQKLVINLREQGKAVWYDEDNAHHDLWSGLATEIDNSIRVIFVASAYSLRSKMCHDELAYAIETQKTILVIDLEDITAEKLHDLHRDWVKEDWGAKANANWGYLEDTYVRHKMTRDYTPEDVDKLLHRLDDNLEYVARAAQWEQRARIWEKKLPPKDSMLLSGEELAEAIADVNNQANLFPKFSDILTNFIAASILHEKVEIERKRRTTNEMIQLKEDLERSEQEVISSQRIVREQKTNMGRLRNFLVTYRTLVLLIMVGFIVVAAVFVGFVSEALAERQQESNLQRTLTLTKEAQLLLSNDDPEVAILLLLQASKLAYTEELDLELQRALQQMSYTTSTLPSDGRPIVDMAQSPNERFLAFAQGRDIQIWEMDTLTQIQTITDSADVAHLEFSDDSNFIMSISINGDVALWDGRVDWRLSNRIPQTGNHAIVFQRGMIVTDGQYGRGQVRHMQNLNSVKFLEGHTDDILSLTVSPNLQQIVTAGADNTVRIWDAQTYLPIRRINYPQGVQAVMFTANGKWLIVSHPNEFVTILNAETFRPYTTLQQSSPIIDILELPPQGTICPNGKPLPYDLTIGGQDGKIRLWSFDKSQPYYLLSTASANLTGLAYSSKDHAIIASDIDGKLLMYSLCNIKPNSAILGFQASERPISALHYLSNGGVFVADRNGRLSIWDQSQVISSLSENPHVNRVTDIAFSPDGTSLALASMDWSASIWDIRADGLNLKHVLHGHQHVVTSLAYSMDGQQLVTGGNDNQVIVWSTTTGHELFRLGVQPSDIASLSFSPNGNWLLTATLDGMIHLWDAKNSYAPSETSYNNGGEIRVAVFAQDSQSILFGTKDKKLMQWFFTSDSVMAFSELAEAPIRDLFLFGQYVIVAAGQQVMLYTTSPEWKVERILLMDDPVEGISMNANDELIISTRGGLSRWDIHFERLQEYACDRISRDLTDEERVKYDLANGEATCP